jgi:AMIN domain
MKSLLRVRDQFVAFTLLMGLLSASSAGQSAPQLLASTDGPVIVRSVRVLPGQNGPAVEILSSRPLVPSISRIENPPRLVIDLPNALLSGIKKRIDFTSDQISGVRVNQYQNTPPITRVVVDLVKPVGETWDAAGNRLMIRLRASETTTPGPPSVPVFTQGIQPVAVPLSPGSSGAVILAGSHIAAGSSVIAGSDTSVLRLTRGGEVLVCPGTTVSVTSSQNGHALMLGMSTGALEAHYNLDASADSILTPDFRILLAGPGDFHYAVSADSRGNTCVRALPGNTASVIVSELLGDGNYQVKPTEQIMFRSGHLNLVDNAVPASCGCPPPAIPVLQASSEPTQIISDTKLSTASMKLAQPGDELKSVAVSTSTSGSVSPNPSQVKVLLPPETAALPASKPSDVHVQVDAPFVFRAEDINGSARRTDNPPPSPILDAELRELSTMPRAASFETAILPPSRTQTKTAHHGVLGKIKGFFVAIFS